MASFAVLTDHTEKMASWPLATIQEKLQSNSKTGLTSVEAARRLKAFGPNEMTKEEPTPLWQLVLDQFADLIVMLLCAAAAISLILGEIVEGLAIVAIVTINAVFGVVQEAKAEAALDALKSMSTVKARVIRDGILANIESAELVQGDLVVLETGASIPADIRLIDTQDLESREAPLTGEPEPVKKNAAWVAAEKHDEEKKDEGKLNPINTAYMGCEVSNGRGSGFVIKTGMQTNMGSIAHMLNKADSGPSPLQQRLENLGHQMGIGAIFICGIVFVVGMVYGKVDEHHHAAQPLWLQMLLTSVSLAVAAVPEGLPAAVTITLALGMSDMVKRNALIRNLHSVETLGCCNVICTDKTGTLTKGEMTSVRLSTNGKAFRITGSGFDPLGEIGPVELDAASPAFAAAVASMKADPELYASIKFPLLLAAICSNASLRFDEEKKRWQTIGNSSECPLVVAAAKAGIRAETVADTCHRIKENPFNSERKMMSVLSTIVNPEPIFAKTVLSAKHVAVVKGAPNVILRQCTHIQDGIGKTRPLTPQDQASIMAQVDAFSSEALRVLAIAYKPYAELPASQLPQELEQGLILAGLIASIDPERQEVPGAIRSAHKAGIRVVMITGDYLLTARAIATNINLIEKGAGVEKAIDCEEIRRLGNLVRAAENVLDASKNDQAALKQKQQAEDALDLITAVCDVYARAKPEDKITIVKSLQRQGNICSMTGDGVNDAPALKQADIGVAMGITGTDVSKAAAAMVLTDDNFCSIVGAIEQGRIIYSNIQKFVFFLISCNISEILIIFFCIISGLASPMEPIQLLWMNLVTDGAPALALAMEEGAKDILDEAPRPKTESIIDNIMFTGIIIQSIVTTIVVLAAYYIGLIWHTPEDIFTRDEELLMAARTMAFVTMSMAELTRAYTVRHNRQSVFTIGVWGNSFMQYAVFGSASLVIFVASTPGVQGIFNCCDLTVTEWIVVSCLSLFPALVEEITKAVYRATKFGIRVSKAYVAKPSESKKNI